MNHLILDFILKRKYLFLIIFLLILLRLTVFSNRYSGVSNNEVSSTHSYSSELLNISQATNPIKFNQFLNYFVYESLIFSEEEKQKDFTFSGQVLNIEMPYPYRVYAYIRLFTDDQNIVYEEMREIYRASNQFELHKDLSTHVNYDFLQYGIMLEGPHKSEVKGRSFVELGHVKSEELENTIQVSISRNLVNTWSVLSERSSGFGKEKIIISDYSDEDEIKVLVDEKNQSIKIVPDFTLWLSEYPDE